MAVKLLLILILMETVYQRKIKSELVGKSYRTSLSRTHNLQTVKTNKFISVCGRQCKQSSAGQSCDSGILQNFSVIVLQISHIK